MCTICFSSAQVVPLGALYLRARFVAAREKREAASATPWMEQPEYAGPNLELTEAHAERFPATEDTPPVRELSLAGRT